MSWPDGGGEVGKFSLYCLFLCTGVHFHFEPHKLKTKVDYMFRKIAS